MTYVLVPQGDGYIAHTNVNIDSMSLPDEAEVYDDRGDFEDRLTDFD